MQLTRQSTGKVIVLDASQRLGSGGEAHVYGLPQGPGLVAKVYHEATPERAAKLAVMVANAPNDPAQASGHVAIAWPVDLLAAESHGSTVVAGYLMPHVRTMRPLFEFYNPSLRRKHCPLFNYLYLHRAAANLASAVSALHAKGYVIGDVNESNILISDTALVTLIDTDSFQVRDPSSGHVYRCMVGKPEFAPPELHGKTFGSVDRAVEHDAFALAVLIFRLLMEGTHPFDGRYKLAGDAPTVPERIASGHFPHGARAAAFYSPKPAAPSFGMLHPALQQMFLRCFEDGHSGPGARPNAQAWRIALEDAGSALVVCTRNGQHHYGPHLTSCPWCERARQMGGRDPFPSKQSVRQGAHLPALGPSSGTRTVPVVGIPPLPIPVLRRRQFLPANGRTRRLLIGAATAALAAVSVTGLVESFPPDTGFAQGAYGHILLQLKDYEDAEPPLRNAVQLEPANAAYMHDLGTDLVGQHKYEDAESFLREAARLDPKKPAYLEDARSCQAQLVNSIGSVVSQTDTSPNVTSPGGEVKMATFDTVSPFQFVGPAHKGYLAGYYIYKCDVTVEMYRKYCAATGHAMPPASELGLDMEDRPIVNLTWSDAYAYAKWSGATLPPRDVWESSGVGAEGRVSTASNYWDP